MKIKVKELLDRKASIKKQKEMLDSLKSCEDDRTGSIYHITDVQAETVEATLEEYEELLDALLESAEVSV